MSERRGVSRDVERSNGNQPEDRERVFNYVQGKGMAYNPTRGGDDSVAECIDNAIGCVQASQHGSLKGTGMFDDQVLFTELYKFLHALGKQAGYQVESVRDIKEALSSGQLTKKDVEEAYIHATGKRADFHQISQKVGRTMRILELVA